MTPRARSGQTPAVERHVRVARTARFYQRGTPGAATREIWIACHGYAQLAAPFATALAPLDEPHRVVVVPEALSRFYVDDAMKRHGPDSPVGATWMTREDREHEIADYVGYLDVVSDTMRAEVGSADVAVVAFGFSQGVATVCRWVALGRTSVARMILWGGAIPTDLPETTGAGLFRGASVVLVAGRLDSFASVATMEQQRDALARQGIDASLMVHDKGHTLSSALLRELGGVSTAA